MLSGLFSIYSVVTVIAAYVTGSTVVNLPKYITIPYKMYKWFNKEKVPDRRDFTEYINSKNVSPALKAELDDILDEVEEESNVNRKTN